jgi:hypothetical protein
MREPNRKEAKQSVHVRPTIPWNLIKGHANHQHFALTAFVLKHITDAQSDHPTETRRTSKALFSRPPLV